jgi:hypothetical protein
MAFPLVCTLNPNHEAKDFWVELSGPASWWDEVDIDEVGFDFVPDTSKCYAALNFVLALEMPGNLSWD